MFNFVSPHIEVPRGENRKAKVNPLLAITMLLLRFSISQMDVPTRQSYTLAVVSPEERSSAAGVTGIARTFGASLAPIFSAPLIGIPALAGVRFIIFGVLKLIYDFSLYYNFKATKTQEKLSSR